MVNLTDMFPFSVFAKDFILEAGGNWGASHYLLVPGWKLLFFPPGSRTGRP